MRFMKKSYSTIKDKDGKHKRVLVEQKVKSHQPLLSVQAEISKLNPDFQPEVAKKLHMTVAHFGIPEELYEDFRKVNSYLTFEQFLVHFYKLIQKCDDKMPNEIKVKAEKLDIFGGSPHQVAVIKIAKTPKIMQGREVISQALKQFAYNLGVEDVRRFMLQSPNLQYNPDGNYKPHITLGYVGKNTNLPKIDVSNLRIVLKPAEISGVRKTSN